MGKYEMRLMVALDVDNAINGQYFDLYQGIGPAAGHSAGYYNHYGRVWVLSDTSGAQLFSANPHSSVVDYRLTAKRVLNGKGRTGQFAL